MSYFEDAALATASSKQKEAILNDSESGYKKRTMGPIWNTMWGVFSGLWLFALTAGIVYELTK